jgi:hypothetical protein
MGKGRFRAVWLSCCVLLAGCTPSGGSLGWERSDGTAVVRRSVEAHGGLDRWRSFEQVSFHYQERWSHPFRVSNPWPSSPIELDLVFGLHDGRVEASPMPSGDWRPEFVLPRTHYLTLLPWKFLDTGARREYLGRRDGFDVVLVTFGDSAGDTPKDRYWAHFCVESGRMERVILTVTAYGPLAVGDLRYEGYREVQGLLLPSRIRALLAGVGVLVHFGEYSEWTMK